MVIYVAQGNRGQRNAARFGNRIVAVERVEVEVQDKSAVNGLTVALDVISQGEIEIVALKDELSEAKKDGKKLYRDIAKLEKKITKLEESKE